MLSFATEDAATEDLLNDGHAFSANLMAFGPSMDKEPSCNMPPISLSFADWNPETDTSFLSATLERDFQYVQLGNCETLCEQQDFLSEDFMALFDNWNDLATASTPVDTGRRISSGLNTNSTSDDTTSSVSKSCRLGHCKPMVSTVSSRQNPEDREQTQFRLRKSRERNRLAASNCRYRKKKHTLILENCFKEQSDKRDRLNSEISQLRSELLDLKNEFFQHCQCDDEPIKLHLAQMLKKIVYKN